MRKYKSGYEAINFLPGPDGKYYVYAPPHQTPENLRNWLVIIVAASTTDNGRTFGPLQPVGWLANASFVEKTVRPEYADDPDFPLSTDGGRFVYSLVARDAFLIPPLERGIPLPSKHGRKLGMGSRFIVRENGMTPGNDAWRSDYADYATGLLARFWTKENLIDSSEPEITDPSMLAQDPTNQGYPTAEYRRKVEKAAEEFAKLTYRREYAIRPVMLDNLGYDFHMTHRKSGKVIFLEIKGTSGTTPAFYLTANEKRCLDNHTNDYRILVVTEALSALPKGSLITPAELHQNFKLDALAWRVQPMPSPKD